MTAALASSMSPPDAVAIRKSRSTELTHSGMFLALDSSTLNSFFWAEAEKAAAIASTSADRKYV